MKAKAAIFGDITIEKSIELGLIVCGARRPRARALEGYWKDMRFGNLLVLCSSERSRRSYAPEYGAVRS